MFSYGGLHFTALIIIQFILLFLIILLLFFLSSFCNFKINLCDFQKENTACSMFAVKVLSFFAKLDRGERERS